MARAWVLSAAGGLGLACLPAPADAAEYQRGSAPAWVQNLPLDMEAKPPLGQASNGVHYLLADQQIQLEASGKTTFRRSASRALNERGVESVAQVSVDFDPSYQRLTLHSLKVYRDGRVQDRLPSAQIKVLQRESELEYQVYDGSKTVDVVLEDIRVGDIVEYAYSLRGSNPVFEGAEFGRMDMRWRVPVHHLFRRLRVPAGRDVQIKSPQDGAAPAIHTAAGWDERVWQAHDVAPFARQNDAPRWYDPYAAVQWSEFTDWAAVARWAEPLYAEPARLSGPLRAEVDRIAAKSASPEDRLREVLAFVQSQIRYLGVEVGPGSHAPRSPETVLARRYGDCKDKVRLAVTMLHALGVTAYPALVDTRLRQVVADQLPSPGAFNHVILHARVGDKEFWLDPTRAPQKGSLDRLAQASFGRALLLDGRSTDLATMPVPANAEYRREIAMDIDASHGFGQAVTMQVRTTYEGASADEMRDTLRNDNLDDLQRNYLNYYLRSYPSLVQDKPLTFADDEQANRLVTTEFYRVDSLWAKNPSEGKPVVYLYAPDMKHMLARPDDTVRTAPLALEHPEDLTVKLSAVLPEERSIEGSSRRVRSKAFEFDEMTRFADHTLQLTYHYRSLTDHVKAGDLPSYLSELEAARRMVGYTLRPVDKPSRNAFASWVTVLAGLLTFALGGWIVPAALRVHADRPMDDQTGTAPLPTEYLLATGHGLLHAPFAALVCLTLLIGGLYGRVDLMGWWGVLLAWIIHKLWAVYWTDHWIEWSDKRASNPTELHIQAIKRRLPLDRIFARRNALATGRRAP